MPSITEAEIDRLLNAVKGGYHTILKGEEQGTPFIRLQIDDFILAEFSGYQDGRYTSLSGPLDIDALRTLATQNLQAHRMPEADAAMRANQLVAPLHGLGAGRDIDAVNRAHNHVASQDGDEVHGLTVSETAFLKTFRTLVKTHLKDASSTDDAYRILEGACRYHPDVLHNPRTSHSREMMGEALDGLIRQYEVHDASAPDYKVEHQCFAAGLKRLKAEIDR